jgi:DNA-directed RNA polymerase subunit RPC12/RpoP
MDHIDIENGTIRFEDKWYSAEDLKREIQDKINTGDMKFSRQAAMLEELNTALETAHVLETRIVLTQEQYEKLILIGGGNDVKCVRKAVLAYIEGNDTETPEVEFVASDDKTADKKPAAGAKKKAMTINCSKCAAPIEIDMTDMPSEIRCPSCNARGVLKTHKNKPNFQDHYMG